MKISLSRDRLKSASVHSELGGHIDLTLAVHLTERQSTAGRQMPGILKKDRVAYLLHLHTEVKSSRVFVRATEAGLEEQQ